MVYWADEGGAGDVVIFSSFPTALIHNTISTDYYNSGAHSVEDTSSNSANQVPFLQMMVYSDRWWAQYVKRSGEGFCVPNLFKFW